MDFFIAACIAFTLTFITLPVVINVLNSIDLLDIPDRRKIHRESTPSLGGIPFVFSALLSLLIVMPFSDMANIKFLLAGILITFILGIRDDVSSLNARQKLMVQSLAAFLVVHFLGIYLSSFHGFLGFQDISPLQGELISAALIVVLTNAFNLIDGIDGLAGGVAMIVFTFLGVWFYYNGVADYALLSITMSSAVLAFMYFNWYPSKIFMGDTGSMVLGFILSTILIKFIQVNEVAVWIKFDASVAMAIGLFVLPIYDTLRVFIKRLIQGRSPFKPDRNHVHHILLNLGFTHGHASAILLTFVIAMTAVSWLLQPLGNNILIIFQLSFVATIGAILDKVIAKRLKRKQRQLDGAPFHISKSA